MASCATHPPGRALQVLRLTNRDSAHSDIDVEAGHDGIDVLVVEPTARQCELSRAGASSIRFNKTGCLGSIIVSIVLTALLALAFASCNS